MSMRAYALILCARVWSCVACVCVLVGHVKTKTLSEGGRRRVGSGVKRRIVSGHTGPAG